MRANMASYALASSLLKTGGGPKSSLSVSKSAASDVSELLWSWWVSLPRSAAAMLSLGGDACAAAGTVVGPSDRNAKLKLGRGLGPRL